MSHTVVQAVSPVALPPLCFDIPPLRNRRGMCVCVCVHVCVRMYACARVFVCVVVRRRVTPPKLYFEYAE